MKKHFLSRPGRYPLEASFFTFYFFNVFDFVVFFFVFVFSQKKSTPKKSCVFLFFDFCNCFPSFCFLEQKNVVVFHFVFPFFSVFCFLLAFLSIFVFGRSLHSGKSKATRGTVGRDIDQPTNQSFRVCEVNFSTLKVASFLVIIFYV